MRSIEQVARDYIALRRSLGYKLKRSGRYIPEFGRFVDDNDSDMVTRELAVRWATRDNTTSATAAARRLGMVRGFAKHLSVLDPRTEIPRAGLLPRRSARRPPYIYSDSDVAGLLAAARALKRPFQAHTYATLFGLLALTGMRLGEATRLTQSDVDLNAGCITIRNTKFGKSRINPLHATVVVGLRTYAEHRDQTWPAARSDSFFVSLSGRPLLHQNVHYTFLHRLLPVAGLTDCTPRRPRIHDLRHTFAVQTLVGWYRAGDNVAARLASLSTWLGHVCPSTTYWYLSATPELMGHAVARLEHQWEERT